MPDPTARLRFHVDANYLGATFVDVPGNGSCAFYSLAHQMLIRYNTLVDDRALRRSCADFLEHYADVQWGDVNRGYSTYAEHILAGHNSVAHSSHRVGTWHEYLNAMRGKGYGDLAALAAAAALKMKARINVISSEHAQVWTFDPPTFANVVVIRELYLGNLDNGHYQSIVLPGDAHAAAAAAQPPYLNGNPSTKRALAERDRPPLREEKPSANESPSPSPALRQNASPSRPTLASSLHI
jgi:hypothetical protein